MFENNEQHSIESRVGNVRSQNRDMRKLRWQHSVRNMQSKRLSAIVGHNRNQGERGSQMQCRQGRTSEDIPGVKRGDTDESIFAWPTGRGEKLETAISGGEPGSAGKEKEIYN